jgi:hypothetical protein
MTMPPISSGSTLRLASTFRPAACSIWATIPWASASLSSRAVVSSTVRRRSSRAISRSSSAAMSSSSPARPFSATTSRKFLNSGSSSPTMSERISAFAPGSSWGLRRTARSSGVSATAAAKSCSASWICGSLPASFAAP